MSTHIRDSSRRERVVTACHYLTAFVLALEGASHLEHSPTPWLFIALCWASAIAVSVTTLAHHRIEPRFPAVQAIVHLSEGAVSSALVYLTHHEGKTGLPFVWAIAAAFLLGRAAWEITHHSREGASRHPDIQPGKNTESNV